MCKAMLLRINHCRSNLCCMAHNEKRKLYKRSETNDFSCFLHGKVRSGAKDVTDTSFIGLLNHIFRWRSTIKPSTQCLIWPVIKIPSINIANPNATTVSTNRLGFLNVDLKPMRMLFGNKDT